MSSGTAPPETVPAVEPEKKEKDVLDPTSDWPSDPAAAAKEAFKRGHTFLKEQEHITDAIMEFSKASQYQPNNFDYLAALAWAKFCAAPDKQAVADVTRKTLGHAISRSDTPEQARFYLGRVERMLGRDREALGHFHEVLMMQPRHADAAAEIRVIEARLASSRDGGFFGRKR
jgi:cytochrome c-type biogenesis protein CcmH/NrfG